MSKVITHNDQDLKVDGLSMYGILKAEYPEIARTFGEPIREPQDDFGLLWIFKVNGSTYTLYSKDSFPYDYTRTEWCIGAESFHSVWELEDTEFFQNFKASIKL